ncbi:hypothetical protein J2Y45_003075 [Dyadobacter sp. BE34]|uniref:Lipoprotein n=1 Tax=Dyadobacter fermentans TaxID=94254 RepID=A0ABU1QUF7_9BACT|nr:hypothetical protein [Dyadobacter fermentans]MDR7043624.1 hypothetical protein [Dyadobacter sp. BE242]MDR7197936.1 hypothetical protein [Dyadobacter sp. BE34]MDR7214631.1 hypothetical protein [Dyadobacter sp. BE31]MDR7262166.1 hypothetical protein [Dyadobacter sp. BE32]
MRRSAHLLETKILGKFYSIRKTFILISMVLISCNGSTGPEKVHYESKKNYRDFTSDQYHLVYSSGIGDVVYDSKSDSLKGTFYQSMVYKDTMKLSQRDMDRIANNFYRYRIDRIKGVKYIDKVEVSHSMFRTIAVFKKAMIYQFTPNSQRATVSYFLCLLCIFYFSGISSNS